MPTFQGLGSALRVLRQRRGLRQKEAAARAGVTKAMMSAYEQGKVRPCLASLERILDALGASLSELDQELRLVAHAGDGSEGVKGGGDVRLFELRGFGLAKRTSEGVARPLGPSLAVKSVDRTLLLMFEAWLEETRALLRRQLGS